MKKAITIFLIIHSTQVVLSAFDLYGSMDDARSAIMSFYDPTRVENKPKPVKPVPADITKNDRINVKLGSSGSITRKKPKTFIIPRLTYSVRSSSVLVKNIEKIEVMPMSKYTRIKGPVVTRPKLHKHSLNKFKLLGSATKSISSKRSRKFPSRSRSKFGLGKPKRIRYLKRFGRLPSVKQIKPTQTAKKSPKSATSKRISLNKFAEAIEDIEKALADAQIVTNVRHNEQRLRKLRDLIKTAMEKRSYRFARKVIGEAMFTIKKINEQRY